MRIGVLGALAAAALFAACSESTGPGDGGLTRAEALAIAAEVARAGDDAYAQTGQSAIAADGEVSAISIEHQSQHPCPVSGTAELALTVALSYDEGTRTLDYHAAGDVTHRACAFREDRLTFTVDGDPNLAFDARLIIADGSVGPYTVGFDGAFDWDASDGRAGRCAIELDVVTDFVARKRTLGGSVCGHSIQQTIGWS